MTGERRTGEETEKLLHVGGVNKDAGGVDPEIDKTLMRLSGGPD